MRCFNMMGASLCVLGMASVARADKGFVDCGKESLAAAVANIKEKILTIQFTGVCHGPVLIATDGVTLKGIGTAVIEGDGGHLDCINLYTRNIERMCRSREEVEDEVRITVLHETAHFFGMSEEDLEAIGLD